MWLGQMDPEFLPWGVAGNQRYHFPAGDPDMLAGPCKHALTFTTSPPSTFMSCRRFCCRRLVFERHLSRPKRSTVGRQRVTPPVAFLTCPQCCSSALTRCQWGRLRSPFPATSTAHGRLRDPFGRCQRAQRFPAASTLGQMGQPGPLGTSSWEREDCARGKHSNFSRKETR